MKRLMESSRKLSCAMYKSFSWFPMCILNTNVLSVCKSVSELQIQNDYNGATYVQVCTLCACPNSCTCMWSQYHSCIVLLVYTYVYLSSVSAIIHLRMKDWRTCTVVCSAAQSWRFWGMFLSIHVVVHRMNNRMTHKMFRFVYCVITSHISYWQYLCDTHSSGTTFEPWYWTTSFASYVYTYFVYITYYCINHSLRLRGTRLTKESGTTLSTILKGLSLLKWLL